MVRTLLALALALLPGLAHAHAHETHPTLTLVAPADGDDEVPTNTLVWLDDETAAFPDDTSELHLLGPEGDDIVLTSASEIATPIAAITVWQPARELLPDSRYVLWQCSPAACEHKLGELRTRSGPATAAPPIPTATAIVESGDHIVTDAEFNGLLVFAAAPDDLDADERSGEIFAVGLPGEPAVFHAHLAVNSLRIGTYDLAGNFSGFSEPYLFEREKSPVCGACDVSDDPPGALLVVLMGLAVRRRRR